MYLVVGLGNPGPQYAGNRHNVGFMVVEELASRAGGGPFREKFSGLFTKVSLGAEDVVLLKPETFMNVSGESVQKAMKFFKVPLKDVVVVHDELDLEFDAARIKKAGGAAGHNGLKSVMQHCGGDGFLRLRVGIGRPRSGRVEGYVLSDFDSSERAELPDVVARCANGVEAIVREGVGPAMNGFNTKAKATGQSQ
jgi:PTH1 family peptidyl-tRNA hydrolase